jgi:hypothetical protein
MSPDMVHNADAALSTFREGAEGQPPRSRSVPYFSPALIERYCYRAY